MDTPRKEQLIQDLDKNFQEVKDWVNSQPKDHFNKEFVKGKWTMAGHIYHLIKSAKATSKGMAMPRLVLRTMFGKSNRKERNYAEMVAKYESVLQIKNVKAPSAYEAEAGRVFERAALLERLQEEHHGLTKAFSKWKDKDAGIYVLPHPAIGKCTIREFILFTILHNTHHLDLLKKQYV